MAQSGNWASEECASAVEGKNSVSSNVFLFCASYIATTVESIFPFFAWSALQLAASIFLV